MYYKNMLLQFNAYISSVISIVVVLLSVNFRKCVRNLYNLDLMHFMKDIETNSLIYGTGAVVFIQVKKIPRSYVWWKTSKIFMAG